MTLNPKSPKPFTALTGRSLEADRGSILVLGVSRFWLRASLDFLGIGLLFYLLLGLGIGFWVVLSLGVCGLGFGVRGYELFASGVSLLGLYGGRVLGGYTYGIEDRAV